MDIPLPAFEKRRYMTNQLIRQEKVYRDLVRDAEVKLLLSETRVCPRRFVEAVGSPKEFSKLVRKTEEGDIGTGIAAFCMGKNYFQLQTPRYLIDIGAGYLKNYIIGKLRAIGDPSSYGVALASRDVVVKIPRDFVQGQTDIYFTHEYAVGILGLNHLRGIIPNFMFTYGLFNCEKPELGPGGVVLTYCLRSQGVYPHLLLERIKDSTSFFEFARNAPAANVLEVLVQLVLALQVAYARVGFVHHDLHSANVLVKRFQNPVVTRFEVERGVNIYTSSRFVPVIIDYGMARIQIPGQDPLVLPDTSIGTYKDPYPIADVLRVVSSILRHATGDTQEFIQRYGDNFPGGVAGVGRDFAPRRDSGDLLRLMKFFTRRRGNALVNYTRGVAFAGNIPPIKRYLGVPPMEYFNFLTREFPQQINQITRRFVGRDTRVYGCKHSGECTRQVDNLRRISRVNRLVDIVEVRRLFIVNQNDTTAYINKFRDGLIGMVRGEVAQLKDEITAEGRSLTRGLSPAEIIRKVEKVSVPIIMMREKLNAYMFFVQQNIFPQPRGTFNYITAPLESLSERCVSVAEQLANERDDAEAVRARNYCIHLSTLIDLILEKGITDLTAGHRRGLIRRKNKRNRLLQR